jgi:DHA1 family bicyclomycin/chloramphenicol resistance-like MFS transporter
MLRPNSFAVTALLTALVALGPLSTDLYLPSLPGMARSFGADVAELQLTLSLFLIGFAVAQLAYGPLSDRFGRRPVMLGGLVLYVVASAACGLAPTVKALALARFAQALGACAGPVLARTVVRDIHGREGAARILAYMSAAMALAPALAPILGGFLETWFGWRSAFALLVAYGGLGIAGILAMLPETNPAPDPAAIHPVRMAITYLTLLRHRAFLGFTVCCALAYSGLFAFISGSSFVLVDMVGLTPAQYGFCFAAAVIGYMGGTLTAGRLTRRVGIERLVLLGGGVVALGGSALGLLAWSGVTSSGLWGVAAIVGPMMVYMAGAGLVLPNSMAGAIGPFPRAAGAASALLGFVQMTVAAGVGIAVGHLHDGTARPMAFAIALVGLLVPLAYLLLIGRESRPPRRRSRRPA